MKKQKLHRKRAVVWRFVTTMILLGAAFYVIWTHRQTVTSILHIARHAHPGWLMISLLLLGGTFCIAAYTYQVLALKPLHYSQTLLVELAGSFIGRLLPAGLGGLGLNGVYLYKRKHTPAEATAIISVNNLLGMCTHGLLLIALCLYQPKTVSRIVTYYHFQSTWAWDAAVAIVVLILVCMLPFIRLKVIRFFKNLLISIQKERPAGVVLAAISSNSLTITYTLLLFCVSHAVGVTLGVFGIFVIFSLGMLVGTVSPTPGGLVGAEAGLFAGFISFGVSDVTAGAAVLLYRLMTYWLPIIPGAIALAIARKQKIV